VFYEVTLDRTILYFIKQCDGSECLLLRYIHNVFKSNRTETERHFQGIFFLYIFHFASYANAASLANILPAVLVEWSFNWPSFAVLLHRCSPFSPSLFTASMLLHAFSPFYFHLSSTLIHSYCPLSLKQTTDSQNYIHANPFYIFLSHSQ
jgi:hypothetical protein